MDNIKTAVSNVVKATEQKCQQGQGPPTSSGDNSKNYSLWPAIPGWAGPTIDLSVHPALGRAARAVAILSKQNSGCAILAGNTGCGKTTFARILLHSIGGEYRTLDFTPSGVDSIWNASFYDEPTLLDKIRESFGYDGGPEQIISRCNKARVLIIDDLGAGYVKADSIAWYNSLIWRIFDNRTDKVTLITTNLLPVQFRERVGFRCYSRLQEMLSISVASGSDNFIDLFEVPDYRKRGF